MDYTNPPKILTMQGKNTIKSMQHLKQRAHKKSEERKEFFEKFRANEHSFRVYTYMDATAGQSDEVQAFLQTVETFGEHFRGVDVDFSTVVDKKAVESIYKEAVTTYNTMVRQLGYDAEAM